MTEKRFIGPKLLPALSTWTSDLGCIRIGFLGVLRFRSGGEKGGVVVVVVGLGS